MLHNKDKMSLLRNVDNNNRQYWYSNILSTFVIDNVHQAYIHAIAQISGTPDHFTLVAAIACPLQNCCTYFSNSLKRWLEQHVPQIIVACVG